MPSASKMQLAALVEKSHATVWTDATTNLWLPIWVGSVPQVDNPFNNLWSVPRLITSASIPNLNHSSHAFSDPLSYDKWPCLTTLKEKKKKDQSTNFWFLNFSVLKYNFCFVSVFYKGDKNKSLSKTASPTALTYFLPGLCLSCGGGVCMKKRRGSGHRDIFLAVCPPSCWQVIDTGFHTDIHFFGVRGSHHGCTNLTLFLPLSPDKLFFSWRERMRRRAITLTLCQSVLVSAMNPSLQFSWRSRILTFKSQAEALSSAVPPLSAFTSETQVCRIFSFF